LSFAVKRVSPKLAVKFDKNFCRKYIPEHPLNENNPINSPLDDQNNIFESLFGNKLDIDGFEPDEEDEDD
jgi:hypothetical protein